MYPACNHQFPGPLAPSESKSHHDVWDNKVFPSVLEEPDEPELSHTLNELHCHSLSQPESRRRKGQLVQNIVTWPSPPEYSGATKAECSTTELEHRATLNPLSHQPTLAEQQVVSHTRKTMMVGQAYPHA